MCQNFRTYDCAKQLYREAQKLNVKSVIRDQLDRAALSIVLNLAEGSGKITEKDRRRFFMSRMDGMPARGRMPKQVSIALGSARECQAIFDLIENTKLATMADSLAAQTYRLCQTPGSLIPKNTNPQLR